MANPIIKGRSAIWGVGSIYTGIILSASRKKDGEVDYIFDANGFTITEIFFDDKEEITVELIVESGTTIPARGDVVTIDSLATCIVQNTEVKWEQKGWKKLSITTMSFVNLSLA